MLRLSPLLLASTVLAATILGSASPTPASAQAILADAPATTRPMLAEPSISPDGATIAFVSGGDIWEVPAAGGVAHLLVTDAATEGRPLYSPDGRKLAFTSTRGGSANIFVLDLASGAVTRVTYAEATEELDAWSPDGRWIYFASSVNDVARQPDIFRVSIQGGTPLEVSRERYLSEFHAAPSPDGSQLALMARGISNVQWWRNGSSHIDQTELWVKPVAGEGGYRLLLDDDARHAWPMWSADGGTLTFMSDKSGTENLWRLSLAPGAQPEQLTHFTDGRLLFPSSGRAGGPVVFERDMAIWRFDPQTGRAAMVPITLRGAPAAEPRRHRTFSSFDRMALSPDGKKVALIAHGELFAASASDDGPTQRLTTSAGAEREVQWAPDSRRILFIAERGLDRRLAEMDVVTGRETLLTGDGVAGAPAYAPDGRGIAYVKNKNELRLYRPAEKGSAAADTLLYKGPLDMDEQDARPAWSPDGKWIAVAVRDARSFTNVYVVPVTGGEARPVSFLGNGQLGKISWAPDGSFLLFDTAQRTEDPRIIRVDLLPHVPKYREDRFRDLFKAAPPGTPADTAPPGEAAAPAAPPKDKPARVASAASVRIVWEGLRDRATALPLGMGAESPAITSDGKTLIFRARQGERDNLYSYSLDEQAVEPPSAKQISASDKLKGDFALSADGKTLVYLEGGKLFRTPVAEPKPKTVAATAEMDVDFAAERQVVFDQAWGTLNRGFFDPAFNGHNWKALRERFQPYALGSQNPDELRRVINLMIGELNASHLGLNRPVRGEGALPTGRVGDLGLRFDRTIAEAGGGLVVRELVPLGPAAVEGNIKPGDRLVSIDGRSVGERGNLDALLEQRVGKRVTLGIAGAKGMREAVVRPVSAAVASGLLYRGWVADRRALVEARSGGQLGYVHILDMSADSLDQLYLDLDASNQSKKGVVIDIRNNNGGFVNGYALDVFSRRNYLLMTPRDLFPLPSRQALGQRALGLPTVLVTNESSLSDAEDFTEGYRTLGLGKVVGQPTSGWIIYTSPVTLVDGSVLRLPHTRIQDSAGRDMEMHPRAVDIAVQRMLGSGRDEQLEAAARALEGTIASSRKGDAGSGAPAS